MSLTLTERRFGAAGLMPPLHAHADDATYYVLAGSLTFFVGHEVVPVGSGGAIVVRGGVPHAFRAESAGARLRVLARPPSAAALDDFALALALPAGAWPSEEERAAVAAIGGRAGISVLGPPGALPA